LNARIGEFIAAVNEDKEAIKGRRGAIRSLAARTHLIPPQLSKVTAAAKVAPGSLLPVVERVVAR
jgi:hypothetical protein